MQLSCIKKIEFKTCPVDSQLQVENEQMFQKGNFSAANVGLWSEIKNIYLLCPAQALPSRDTLKQEMGISAAEMSSIKFQRKWRISKI